MHEPSVEYGVTGMDCFITSAANIVNYAVHLVLSPRLSGEHEYDLPTANWTRGVVFVFNLGVNVEGASIAARSFTDPII
jgi:hypothetical protein